MGDILGIFRVIRAEPLVFGIFLGVNLFVGGMAVWLPPVLATQNPVASPAHELLVALRQGNGYLFGLAVLAATSSYWLREYLNSQKSDFKTLKIFSALLAAGLMTVMALFLGSLISGGFLPPSATSTANPPTLLSSSALTQIALTLFAFVMAVYLFCLEHIDNYPQFGKALRDKTTREIEAGMDGQSITGYKT
jgi:hypothetical protein